MLFLLLFCGYASAEYRLFVNRKNNKKRTGIVPKTRKSHLYYTRYWLKKVYPFIRMELKEYSNFKHNKCFMNGRKDCKTLLKKLERIIGRPRC